MSAEHFLYHAPCAADAADAVGNVDLIGVRSQIIAADNFYAIGVFFACEVVVAFHQARLRLHSGRWFVRRGLRGF